jgi:hypothetical protein
LPLLGLSTVTQLLQLGNICAKLRLFFSIYETIIDSSFVGHNISRDLKRSYIYLNITSLYRIIERENKGKLCFIARVALGMLALALALAFIHQLIGGHTPALH